MHGYMFYKPTRWCKGLLRKEKAQEYNEKAQKYKAAGVVRKLLIAFLNSVKSE